MCGRYLITSTPEAMRQLFKYLEQPNFPPRYNVAPTQPIPIVRLSEGQRQFALVRWGLIPSWVKDPKTLLADPAGAQRRRPRQAVVQERHEVPPLPDPGRRLLRMERGHEAAAALRGAPTHGKPVAFAGLWEAWMGPNGEEMETAAVVTCEANKTLHPIHHRMPVVIPRRGLRSLARLPQRRCADGGGVARAGAGGSVRGLRNFDRGEPGGKRLRRIAAAGDGANAGDGSSDSGRFLCLRHTAQARAQAEKGRAAIVVILIACLSRLPFRPAQGWRDGCRLRACGVRGDRPLQDAKPIGLERWAGCSGGGSVKVPNSGLELSVLPC